MWPDATKVGEKIYHASCYQEAFKDGGNNGGNTPSYARGTPEPVTGKRKAEVSFQISHFDVVRDYC